MIHRDRPQGSEVWFLDEPGHVRRGELVRMTDTQVCVHIGTRLLIVPRRRCYADKATALTERIAELGTHIATMANVHRELVKQLDPRPCRTAGVCFAGYGHCPHDCCSDPATVTISTP